MIGSDLDAKQYLGTMIVKGEGGIHSNTNKNGLRYFSNEMRRCQRREVAADGQRSCAPSSTSCWGLMKDHDLGFFGVDCQPATLAPVLSRLHHGEHLSSGDDNEAEVIDIKEDSQDRKGVRGGAMPSRGSPVEWCLPDLRRRGPRGVAITGRLQ